MLSGAKHLIRVAVAAQPLAVRAGLRLLLGSAEAIEVVGEAASLEELQPWLLRVDVLVFTEEAATRSGLSGVLQEGECPAALLLVNETTNPIDLFLGLKLRAWGVIPLDSSAEELLAAVRALHEGLIVGAPHMLEALLGRQPTVERREAVSLAEPLVEPLSGREAEVLQLLAQGLANKQIAAALGISEHTVKFHVSGIYAKLGVAGRTEAVRAGVRRGLVIL